MLERFEGDNGKRLKIDAITQQRIVQGNPVIAAEMADKSLFRFFQTGEPIITQGGSDNEIYLIISGSVNVVVNGRIVAVRGPGNHVGEMAAVEPAHRRSATVITEEPTIVAELKEEDFSDIASRYPEIVTAHPLPPDVTLLG